MARRCPRDREPMMRSAGVEDSGTGITPPVHLHRGGSARFSWSSLQRWKGRVFKGSVGGGSGSWEDCASAWSSARLKSLPRGPGQLQAKTQGSAHVGFLLSLTASGWMEMEMAGCRRHCISSAPIKRVAWGRCLCFLRERRGRSRFWFGTKMMV